MLSLMAGTAGLLIAFWSIDAIRSLDFDAIPRLHDIHLDTTVLIFTLFISLLTGILFWFSARFEVSSMIHPRLLKEGGRSSCRPSSKPHW